jgi:opacity protein-like surface antigen
MYRSISAAVLATALLAGGAAAAADASWYVQGNTGGSFASDLQASPHRSGTAGWVISGEAGRDFGNGWRTDAELLYLDAGNQHGLPGRTSAIGGFVNGYYNFNHNGPWQPFVGGGIGAADVRSIGQDDTQFAWQVKAGLDHPFTKRLTGEVAYRYVEVPNLHGGIEPVGFRGDYHSSAVTIGFRYRFGG